MSFDWTISLGNIISAVVISLGWIVAYKLNSQNTINLYHKCCMNYGLKIIHSNHIVVLQLWAILLSLIFVATTTLNRVQTNIIKLSGIIECFTCFWYFSEKCPDFKTFSLFQVYDIFHSKEYITFSMQHFLLWKSRNQS